MMSDDMPSDMPTQPPRSPLPRVRRRLLLAAAIAAVAAPTARAGCLDFCGFNAHNATDGSVLRTWDFRSLCNDGIGYTFKNGSTLYRFEICGSVDPIVPVTPACVGDGNTSCAVAGAQTNTYCNPEYNAWPNTGSFLAFFDPNPPTTCTYGPTSGLPAPGSFGGCPNVGTTGNMNLPNLCCTGQCEVIAYSSPFDFKWYSKNGLDFGVVSWTVVGASTDAADEFQCPIDPNTGYPRVRSVAVTMNCNASGKISDPVIVNSFYDVADCKYRVEMTHFAACGLPVNNSTGNCSSGGGSNSGGNSQKDAAVSLPNLEAGFSAGLVVAGAAAAFFAVFVAQRCSACRLPRIRVSIKYDDGDDGEKPAMLGAAYASTSTTPLRSLGR